MYVVSMGMRMSREMGDMGIQMRMGGKEKKMGKLIDMMK